MAYDPTTDARKSKTLGEAAANANGTWNGPRALAWLSEALNPGKGVSEEEVRRVWDEHRAALRKRSTDRR